MGILEEEVEHRQQRRVSKQPQSGLLDIFVDSRIQEQSNWFNTPRPFLLSLEPFLETLNSNFRPIPVYGEELKDGKYALIGDDYRTFHSL